MQQGRDRLVLRAAVLENQCRDAEQVRQVGHISAFSALAGMDIGGVHKRIGKASSQH